MPQRGHDPYAILRVAPDATPQQLRRAWLTLARQHHPDRYPSAAQKQQATERLQVINAAYEEVSDPRRRRRLDARRQTALQRRPAVAPARQPASPVATPAGMRNAALPHRYTPGNKYVVFDGVTYMNLAEAARRLRQPVARLSMYVENGELNAFAFDNQQWVTEASLIPLRTRHRREPIGTAQRAWTAVVPHLGRPPRQVPGAVAPRPSNSIDRRFDAPRVDQRAAGLLQVAPTLFLMICGVLLYAYLANFALVWPALMRVPQVLGG